MKFKLDENIPIRLVSVLGGLGHDIDTVPQESLTGRRQALKDHDAERVTEQCELMQHAPEVHPVCMRPGHTEVSRRADTFDNSRALC